MGGKIGLTEIFIIAVFAGIVIVVVRLLRKNS
jgi:hypothetical protein